MAVNDIYDQDVQLRRITYYETLLQELVRVVNDPDAAPEALLSARAAADELEQYYTSSLWKRDFSDDEAGRLPWDLRRGVLSEDGIYNALESFRERLEELEEPETPPGGDRPYYDREAQTWRVDFPDRPSEEGSLLYVLCEFARAGLYYPYNDTQTRGKPYPGHGHAFEDVLRALLDDPKGFEVRGFEEFYAGQELELLDAIQKKLLQTE